MQTVEPLLGTRGEVAVTAPSPAVVATAEAAVLHEARRLEKLFTVFDEHSAIREFRRNGSTDVVELQIVVALALEWHRRTGGAFHPALQPLIDVWDVAEAEARLPRSDGLATVVAELAATRQGQLNLTHLNLNGLAKGWIVDRSLATAFDQPSVTSAWLSLGGDLTHRGEASLRVGIEDPTRPYDNVAPLATIELSNEALATSGSGRRWWNIDGVRYSKVLDPRTGQPAGRVSSATVVAPTAASADALATTCLVLQPDEALLLTKAEGAQCFLVCNDGSVVTSSARFRQA